MSSPVPSAAPSAALPVAVGRTRQHASDVFGPSFDRLLLTTYDERADAAPGTGFVGIAADPDMGATLEWGLALLGADPGLGLAVELPRDPGLSGQVADRLAGAPVRVVGVRRFGDHPCLVLGAGADESAPGRIADALEAAVQQRAPLGVALDDARQTWELAAHQQRSDHLERQIRDVRVRLARRTAELDELRETSTDAAPDRPQPGMSRRQRLAHQVGLAVVVVLVLAVLGVDVWLLAGGGAVRVALALALLLLVLVLLAVGATVPLLRRLAARVDRPSDTGAGELAALVERVGGIEVTQAELVGVLDALPERLDGQRDARPGGPDPDDLGARIQGLATLYAVAPPTADVPVLSAARVDLAVLAVGELLGRAPALALVTGAPDVALFLALAARQHGLATRVVALDDDADRTHALAARATRHGVAGILESRHAPLARTGVEGHRTGFYGRAGWDDLAGIGLAVVAGPADTVGPGARLPFVPLLGDRFADEVSVLLPDADDAAYAVEPWARVLGVAGTDLGSDVLAFRR